MVVEPLAENEVIDDAAEEAAFESGFAGTDLEPAPEETQAEETVEETPEQNEEPPAEEVKPLSVDDLKAMLEAQQHETQKLRDTLFGKIGNLQQKIDSAKSASSGLSAKARERLEADFPELAEMLFDKDAQVQDQGGYTPPSQTFVPPDLPGVEEVEKKFERKLLTRDHRDWEQVVVSPDFATWKATALQPEDAAELDDSWDADYVSSKITEFKAWRDKQIKKAAENKAKQNRLESATVPRGLPRDGGSGYSDDDEEASMLASFGKRS